MKTILFTLIFSTSFSLEAKEDIKSVIKAVDTIKISPEVECTEEEAQCLKSIKDISAKYEDLHKLAKKGIELQQKEIVTILAKVDLKPNLLHKLLFNHFLFMKEKKKAIASKKKNFDDDTHRSRHEISKMIERPAGLSDTNCVKGPDLFWSSIAGSPGLCQKGSVVKTPYTTTEQHIDDSDENRIFLSVCRIVHELPLSYTVCGKLDLATGEVITDSDTALSKVEIISESTEVDSYDTSLKRIRPVPMKKINFKLGTKSLVEEELKQDQELKKCTVYLK